MQHHALARAASGHVGVSVQHLLDRIATASGDTGVSNAIVNLLEPLDFDVHVAKNHGHIRGHGSDLRYVLTVRHRGANTMWHHQRSFDEYETFEKQVLVELHHGHFCAGGCPWLESFIGAAFETTKRSVMAALSTVIERRRKTVLEVMQAHRRFLVNRANHACAYALHHVARVFLEFIYGGVLDSAHVMDEFLAAAAVALPTKIHDDLDANTNMTKKAQRRLRAQSTPGLAAAKAKDPSPHAVTVHPPHGSGQPELCTICEDFMPVKDLYVVRLGCGHRFHDECVMPKLNQHLECPTCHADLAQYA